MLYLTKSYSLYNFGYIFSSYMCIYITFYFSQLLGFVNRLTGMRQGWKYLVHWFAYWSKPLKPAPSSANFINNDNMMARHSASLSTKLPPCLQPVSFYSLCHSFGSVKCSKNLNKYSLTNMLCEGEFPSWR